MSLSWKVLKPSPLEGVEHLRFHPPVFVMCHRDSHPKSRRSYGVITPIDWLARAMTPTSGVITQLVTGRGPPC